MKSLIIPSLFVSTCLARALDQSLNGDGNTKAVWQPALGAKFQIILRAVPQISASIKPANVDIWDVDLFDTPTETITTLKEAGKKVICYFSAGTSEDWRPDYGDFQAADKGECMGDWVGERWLDTRTENVFNIMKKRIELARSKGCDAIDPDNMDGYSNVNGVGLTKADGIKYIRRLAQEAEKYGMSTGLKNAQGFLPDVAKDIHFAVNEQCAAFSGDCAAYEALISLSKPVFHIEYVYYQASGRQLSITHDPGNANDSDPFQGLTGDALRNALCLADNSRFHDSFSTVIKTMDLDGFVLYCDQAEDGGWAWDVTSVSSTDGNGVPPGSIDTECQSRRKNSDRHEISVV